MKPLYKKFVFLFIAVTFFLSCRHDPTIPASPAISFQYDVQSIIIGNCTESGCHSAGSDHPRSLVAYDDVMKAVSPGDAHNSDLYERVVGKSGNIMPPPSNPMLTNDQIRYIYLWIEQGAKNN